MTAAAMLVLTMIIRLFLSVILIRAVLHKVRDHKKFQSELAAYQLLPTSLFSFSLLSLATWVLILIEAFTSVLLLDPTRGFAALVAAGLFCLYALAMAINLVRGRIYIDCGCSGVAGVKKTISWSLVTRNLVLATLAMLSSSAFATHPMNALELFIILAGATVSLLLYETIEQAIANAQGYQRWIR
jgi:hypothetical protein